MKPILIPVLFAGILISCTSSDQSKNTEEETSTTETTIDSALVQVNEQLKPIDTDEALVATAFMCFYAT